jgi:hypothetical protein
MSPQKMSPQKNNMIILKVYIFLIWIMDSVGLHGGVADDSARELHRGHALDEVFDAIFSVLQHAT